LERIFWGNLPGSLKAAIELRAGPIRAVRTATAGENSPLAAIITTDDGMVFAKGMPSDHRRAASQAREIAVAPLVREISPALLWHFDDAGWNVLGYEYVYGRHADYSAGSEDLDGLVQIMKALGEIKIFDADPFKRAEDRWKSYVDEPCTAEIFSGSTLTHTDWTPENVLVSTDRV
jgi:hypothetical protein